MKTVTDLGAILILLVPLPVLLAAEPPLAVEPGRGDSASFFEEAEGALSSPVAEPVAAPLDEGFIYEQLKLVGPEELMLRVQRAHNSLSRDGQEALKDRAMVRLACERARAIIEASRQDAELAGLEQLIGSDEVQQGLAELIEIEDREQLSEAFAEFLSELGVSAASLQRLAALREAEEVLAAGGETIELINQYLGRPTLPVTVGAPPTAGDTLDSIREISAKYGGRSVVAGPAPAEDGEDLLPLLRALLRPPGAS